MKDTFILLGVKIYCTVQLLNYCILRKTSCRSYYSEQLPHELSTNDTLFLRIVKPLFALNQKQLQVHVSGFLHFDNKKFTPFSEIFFIQEQHVCF